MLKVEEVKLSEKSNVINEEFRSKIKERLDKSPKRAKSVSVLQDKSKSTKGKPKKLSKM